MEVKAEDKPFRVVSSTGVLATTGCFVSGHDTNEQAEIRAVKLNEAAEVLKLKTRYVVYPNANS